MVVSGLADGTVLYDALYNHTHPLNITYLSLYNYLNCFESSPCWVNYKKKFIMSGSNFIFNNLLNNIKFSRVG